MSIETVNIAVRRRIADKVPELFFYNSNARTYWLECYARIGQHSQASVQYMHDKTAPVRILDDECRALVREWSNLGGEPVSVRLVARLSRPVLKGSA